MKLNKLAKGVLAASALTVAGFAQADLLSSAKVDVTGLKLNIFDSQTGGNQLFLNNGFTTSNSNVAFIGTDVTTKLNGNLDGESYSSSLGNTGFTLSSTQSSPLSNVYSEAGIEGSIFNPVTGADGITYSYTDVGGYDEGETNSQITNSLTAQFAFTPTADAWAEVSFDWLIDVLVDITWSGGSGNADWALGISLGEKCTFGQTCADKLFEFDLTEAVDDFNNPILTETGEIFENGSYPYSRSGSEMSQARHELKGGQSYTLTIIQNANTAGLSVSEPMSLALFGMGLLGVAGLARRRKLS